MKKVLLFLGVVGFIMTLASFGSSIEKEIPQKTQMFLKEQGSGSVIPVPVTNHRREKTVKHFEKDIVAVCAQLGIYGGVLACKIQNETVRPDGSLSDLVMQTKNPTNFKCNKCTANCGNINKKHKCVQANDNKPCDHFTAFETLKEGLAHNAKGLLSNRYKAAWKDFPSKLQGRKYYENRAEKALKHIHLAGFSKSKLLDKHEAKCKKEDFYDHFSKTTFKKKYRKLSPEEKDKVKSLSEKARCHKRHYCYTWKTLQRQTALASAGKRFNSYKSYDYWKLCRATHEVLLNPKVTVIPQPRQVKSNKPRTIAKLKSTVSVVTKPAFIPKNRPIDSNHPTQHATIKMVMEAEERRIKNSLNTVKETIRKIKQEGIGIPK